MSSPQPAGTLRRPPTSRGDSPSPSPFGTEGNTIPAFQDFIKRTPPPDPAKPLPPMPMRALRTPSNSPGQSRSASEYASRRSSSVYSRTVSQWLGDGKSWTSDDFADEPVPPLPVLQPLAYSASTPHLVKKLSPPDLLQPRMYSPLIITPSPSESRVTLESSPARQHSASPSPAMDDPAKLHKKPVQTISLEQAMANSRSPGAVHLLPEELRAQKLKKSRSHEPLRRSSLDIFSPGLPPDVPQAPTLLDHQGRHRSITLPRLSPAGAPKLPSVGSNPATRSPYAQAFKVGTGLERTMRPPVSLERPTQQTMLNGAQQERGRPRQRKSRAEGKATPGTEMEDTIRDLIPGKIRRS